MLIKFNFVFLVSYTMLLSYLKGHQFQGHINFMYFMFSFRSFTVSHFIFRSMFHFKLNFMKDIRRVLRFPPFFFCLHMDVLSFQHYLLKRLLFLHIIPFVPLLKVIWVCVGLLVASLFSSIYLLVYFFPNTTLVYYSFRESFEIKLYESFNFFFLLKYCVGHSRSLTFCINFRMSISIACWVIVWDWTEYINQVGKK